MVNQIKTMVMKKKMMMKMMMTKNKTVFMEEIIANGDLKIYPILKLYFLYFKKRLTKN
jgi:hypothetical protein